MNLSQRAIYVFLYTAALFGFVFLIVLGGILHPVTAATALWVFLTEFGKILFSIPKVLVDIMLAMLKAY